jgi:transposase InsO family protein
MPWKEQRAVDQRQTFVLKQLTGRVTLAELCREFGISRKTGYKWVQRFLDGGVPNLVDRASVAREIPHAILPELVAAILAQRKRHPTWGPKKLLVVLANEQPQVSWPALSTVAAILKRHGLVKERRPRRRTPQSTFPLAAATEPNIVWCTDFKGKFKVDRTYCHPLTITDAHSRFVIRCTALVGQCMEASKVVFEAAFREYGLPLRMRSDNGTPFASTGIGGLSALSVWWVKLGILPERIEPGHPEQNGVSVRRDASLT